MNEGSSSITSNQDMALRYRCRRWAPPISVKAALRVTLGAGAHRHTPNAIEGVPPPWEQATRADDVREAGDACALVRAAVK
jgi:hypothetical protein